MATTPNLGLHVYGGDVPGSITDNGSQHTAGDRYYLDQVISQLAASPRHYIPPVASIPTNFSLDTDPNSGQLQDGVTYFYRVSLVGLDGFERIASDEASVAMPDVLSAPGAPGIRDAPGGALKAGLYYYALTAKSETQESVLGATANVNVFVGTNQAVYIDAPSDAQGVALQVWRKKDTDPGFTRLGTINAGQTYTDDGSIAANAYALDPAYAPPTSNRGNANSSVTITLVADAAAAADAGTIKSWRIYRSTISGYYSAQSLVHDVVETDDEDGNGEGTLRTSWIDVGDALRVGQPQFKDRSLPLTPYAPESVTALPVDVTVYPANYLVVFNNQLYILQQGEWNVVGGGMKVSFGLPYPASAVTGDLNYQPDLDNWYRYDGAGWQLAIAHQPSLLSGSGAPTATDGLVGDFWLDTEAAAAALYGPKGATTWPATPITLGGSSGGGTPILTSPSGQRYRTVVADDGTLSTIATLEPGPPAAIRDAHLEEVDGRPSTPYHSAVLESDGIVVYLLSGGEGATSYQVITDLGLGPTTQDVTTFPFRTGIIPNATQAPDTTVTVTATNDVGTATSAQTFITTDPAVLPVAPVIAATRDGSRITVTATTAGSGYPSGLGSEPGGLMVWADGEPRHGGGGITLPTTFVQNWGGNTPCEVYVVVTNRYGSATSNTVTV